MSWVYQDFENYRVRNISTGLMYVIYNPVDVEGIISSICLIYPSYLWWSDIHYCCHDVFPYGNYCDGYFCNSIGYYLNWDMSVSSIVNCVSIGKINVAWPKPMITISQHAIFVEFPLLFVRVWKYLISLSLSVSSTMSTKWISSLIWIFLVE